MLDTPAMPLTAGEVLGLPFLPPGSITVVGNRLRALLGRVHAAMAPPPVRILDGLFGILDHRVLVALCQAGVPEALTAPTEIADLAERIEVDASMLERLLRFASTRGWVRVDRRGRVHPTAVTGFLRKDHPGGWRAWVDFVSGTEVLAAVGTLSADPSVTDAFAEVNGSPFFEWMSSHPERWAVFDRAMAAGAQMHALGLAKALDWKLTSTVCDVGGGTGQLLATLLDLEPHLMGTVFDLPDVVSRAVEHPRLSIEGGNAMRHVPSGFDTYLLVNVLHDWNDADCRCILQRAAEAAADQSRIVVVDSDRASAPQADIAISADVLMAALTSGGKERNTSQFAALARSAGLHHEKSVRLVSADLAHVFRRA
jgi:hypothetical protein